jgi:hypothetical protein
MEEWDSGSRTEAIPPWARGCFAGWILVIEQQYFLKAVCDHDHVNVHERPRFPENVIVDVDVIGFILPFSWFHSYLYFR